MINHNFEVANGPFWHREDNGQIRCAFRLEKKHINGGGAVHGGCLMTFADYCLFALGNQVLVDGRGVTLSFSSEFIDAALFEKAIAAVPDARRSAAYEKYRTDKRDTSTPTAMVKLLRELTAGRLLSKKSTAWLLDVMEQTATGPDRLKAGLAKGWRLAHKTGSSGSWQGFTVATNDVGSLLAPDGGNVAVAVFVADTHAEPAAQAAFMASIASAICANYQP